MNQIERVTAEPAVREGIRKRMQNGMTVLTTDGCLAGETHSTVLGAKRFHSSTDLLHQLRWRDAIDVEQPVHTPVTDRIQIEGFGNTQPNVTLRSGPSQLHVGGGQVVTLLEPLPELSGWLVRRSDFGSCQNAVEIFLAATGLRPEMLGKAVKGF